MPGPRDDFRIDRTLVERDSHSILVLNRALRSPHGVLTVHGRESLRERATASSRHRGLVPLVRSEAAR